ncbi:MAG: hypothetical protein ABII18_00535 [bacterium]
MSRHTNFALKPQSSSSFEFSEPFLKEAFTIAMRYYGSEYPVYFELARVLGVIEIRGSASGLGPSVEVKKT